MAFIGPMCMVIFKLVYKKYGSVLVFSFSVVVHNTS